VIAACYEVTWSWSEVLVNFGIVCHLGVLSTYLKSYCGFIVLLWYAYAMSCDFLCGNLTTCEKG
jgi:hypothetical protein